MKTTSFITLILSFCFTTALAQDISNIKISPDQKYFVFLKDKDSLFIKGIDSNKQPSLIHSGFNNDFNERFLLWNPQNSSIVFERGNNIYSYSPEIDKLKKHSLPDNFQLFKYFRIDQAGISINGKLYFSALCSKSNSKNKLFELDLSSGRLSVIASEEFDIANVSVSSNGKLIAYSFYHQVNDESEAGIKIINIKNKKIVYKKDFPNKTFLSNISFDDQNHLLVRNVYGENHIIKFNVKSDLIATKNYSIDSYGYFLRFVNANELLSLNLKGNKRIYTLFNIETEEKKEVVSGRNTRLVDLQTKRDNYKVFFTDEDGKTPKKLMMKSIDNNGLFQEELIYSFSGNNILKDFDYTIFNYENAGAEQSQAYLYLPSNIESHSEPIPMIIMAYGGYSDTYPTLSYFMNKLFFNYVNKGYALAFLNTRGVNNERLGDQYGKIQLEDTETFINDVTKEFNISKDKIIVAGHSHGATMVYYYLTHSTKFAGGIAINGASDWIKQAERKSMTGLPGEMGGAPDSLMAKYEAYSPIENVSKEMSPILIVGGKNDTQIPSDFNSAAFHEKALRLGVKSEFYEFENEGHLILKPENLDLIKTQISRYLEKLIDKRKP